MPEGEPREVSELAASVLESLVRMNMRVKRIEIREIHKAGPIEVCQDVVIDVDDLNVRALVGTSTFVPN